MSRPVTVRLSDDHHAKMLAIDPARTMADLLRQAVAEFIANHPPREKP